MLKIIQSYLNNNGYKNLIVLLVCLSCLAGLKAQTDPTASFGNTFIHSEGNITVFGDHQFKLPIELNTPQPGIIGGEREPSIGYFNFAPGATWVEADSARYVDGYVRHFGNTRFLFPVGDNESFRPIAVSGGAYVEASYFAVDPTLAITSDLRGGDFPILPLTGPFDASIFNDAIIKVSEYEYWDLNGSDQTIITLTWDSNSNVDQLTTNDLERLAIVGWNGAQWEYIPSYIDFASISLTDNSAMFTGPPPSFESGSISTKIPVVPSSYEVYTLASSCLSMDLDVSNEVLICMGDSITLNASSFDEAVITWSTGEIGPSITEAPTENTLYTVTAELGSCEVTREIFVEVRELSVELGQDTFVCSGNDITILAEANYPGSYQWEHRGVLTFGNNSITLENLNTPSTLNVTITDSNGCTAVDSVFIDIRQSPDVFTGRDASVCLGDSTFIQAFGSESGYGYEWSTGDTSSLIYVSPLNNTTYVVSLTENGCTDVSFVEVEVFPQAYIEITNDSIICPGEEILIETEGTFGSYLWSTGDTIQNIIASPIDNETYSVTLTSPGNCEWIDEITFTSYEETIDLGDDIFICEGETVSLSVEGVFDSVLWDDGSAQEEISVTPTSTTSYEVTSYYGECEFSSEVVVNVNNVLTVDLGPDITICQGDSTELSSNSVGQYNWSTGENTNSIFVSPFSTTNYTVTVTSGGCIDEDEITVNVIEDPAFVDILTDPLFCPGQSVFLQTVGSSGGYLWNNGNTSPAFNTTPVNGEVFSVTVTNGSGCTATDEIEFSAYDQGNVDIGPDMDLCVGESIQLQVTGNYETLFWSNGSSNNFITVSPLTSTSYYVTATMNGCQSYDTIHINVIDVLSLELGENITICQGETVDLSVNNVSGQFQWSTGQTGNSITLNPNSTQEYSVTVTSGSCSATDDITIIVEDPYIDIIANPNYCPGESMVLNTDSSPGTVIWNNGIVAPSIEVFPSPGFSYSATIISPNGCIETDIFMPTPFDLSNVNLGPDMEICEGANVTLEIEGDYDLINWSNGSVNNSISVTPLATTDYSVTVTEGTCSISDTVSIIVVENIVLDLGPDMLICEGDSKVLQSNAVGEYLWSTGETSSSIEVSPLQTSTYHLTLTSGLCTSSDSVTIIVESEPDIEITGNTMICPGEQTTLTANGTSGVYLWNTGQFGNQITVTPNPGMIYSVTVTTPNGCTSSDQVTISAFTVNSINLGEDKHICPGEDVSLQLVGTYDQILWSTGETSPIITVNPTQTTSYTVTAWIGNCQVSDQISVIVENNINLDLGPDITICHGQSVELGSNIVGSYLWSTGETSNTITVSPDVTTTYQAYVESGNCNSLDEITITVEYQAYAEITTGEFFCLGETITLESQGSLGSYLWSTGQVGHSTTVTPLDGSIYYVTVTTPDGCVATDSIIMQEYSNQSLFIGQDMYICEGEQVSIHITNPYISLVWEDGSSDNPRIVQPDATTTYSATATFRTCTNTDDITINVSSSIDLDLGDDYNLCPGNSVNIGSTITGNYLWNTGDTTQYINASPNESMQYVLTVNSGNCVAEDSIWVNIDDIFVDITNNPIFCEGELLTLQTNSSENAFLWNTGETSSSIQVVPESNATYSVTVTNSNDCQASDQITLTEFSGGDVLLGPDITICPGGFITLIVKGTFDYVIWGDGFTGNSRVVSPGNTTTYSITAAYGSCFAFDQITVFVEEDLNLDLGPDVTICPGQSVELSDPSTGGIYNWSTGETSPSITVSPLSSSTYTVTVSSGICVSQDEIMINVSEDCYTDLSVIKTSNNFNPSVGDTIELSVLVANDGDIAATNIEIKEVIRSGFELVSHEASGGIYNENTSIWYLDELDADSSELLQLMVEVKSAGDYFNIVEVMESDQLDIDSEPGNGDETEDDFDKITIDVEIIEEVVDTTSEIGDYVWMDVNGDGFQALDENGIENVEVQLFSAGNISTPIAIQYTNAEGYFCFTNLSSGAYFVKFMVPDGLVITKPKFGAGSTTNFDNQDSDIENIYGYGTTGMIYLGIDEQRKDCDGGLYPGGSIGDLVWEDALGGLDDRYDQSIDSGVEGVLMRLFDFNMDTLITEMLTDQNGYYMFTNLKQGTYYVELSLPSDLQHMALVSPNSAVDDIDSDFDPFSWKTASISLGPSQIKDNIDAGLAGSLPLTLLDFWGERIFDEQLNRLFWSTEMEINTDRFEIERSLSSNFDFQYIGEVEAAGNSNATLYYTFDDLDSREAGEYYYRLKMIDLNGQYNYSPVIVIRVNESSDSDDDPINFKVYPIPTTDYLKLEINVDADNTFEGFLVNNLGQHVRSFTTRSISQGLNLVDIDVIDLPQGQYYLNFYIGEEQFIAKVLILD